MKRVGYLYEKMEDKSLIKQVIMKGAKGKKKRWDVKEVMADVDGYTEKIYDLVVTKSYVPTKPRRKLIHDASSCKERTISIVPYYPDGIMHQLVTEVIRPILMKNMYYWSCASIPGRGNAHAIRYMKRSMRNVRGTKYTAKLDIHHYYQNINIDILMGKLERKIKDRDMLKLIRDIVDSDTEEGLSIGFYINQWLANFYLQDIDRMILNLDGVSYYVRQMDDLVLMGPNKRKMHRAVNAIKENLNNMGLSLNHSWQVFRTDSRGVDFVGYRFFHNHVILRRRNLLRLKRQALRISKGCIVTPHVAAGMISRAGQLAHCNGTSIRQRYIDPIKIKKLKTIVKTGNSRILGGDSLLKNAIVIDANEIKKLLAEKFHVPETNIIKSQYSYTVIIEDATKEEKNS